MKKTILLTVLMCYCFCVSVYPQAFSIDDVLAYPFPTELTSSASGSKIAWAFNERGVRNVYVAEGPTFTPRKLTTYAADDGQEISSLSISEDGKWVIFVRGGDHGSPDAGAPVYADFSPLPPKVQVMGVPFTGGDVKILGEGDYAVISPKNDQVAFLKSGQVLTAPPDGSQPAKNMFVTRGTNSNLQWSPDGSALAFVSTRTDHSFIGVFKNISSPIQWVSPSFSRDLSPRWSPDGKQLVFVRTPGSGGAPDSILAEKPRPWSIWTADLATGNARQLWKAPATLRGSVPTTEGGVNLHWAAGDRVVFLSYHDGWPHLYSLPAAGGEPVLLTPGSFMVEQISLSPDRKWMVCSINGGPDKFDIDRRHIARVPVDRAAMEILTPGTGLETYPVITGDASSIAFLSATSQRPLLPAVMPAAGKGAISLLAADHIPSSFPTSKLVIPKPVIFKAPDGTNVHAQLFEPVGSKTKHPAIVYVHGGPQRQMVLGWHFMDYYSIDYALNQYLVSLGFSVLSVNYRLGVGYGYEFHKPPHAGVNGASEYQDIKAAGEWLASQPGIDNKKIGIYGGSYGGFLAALGLGRDSKLFAAGVDIHGVHNRLRAASNQGEHAPDETLAAKVAWESSPIAYVDQWMSPVLLIHADDDRNVPFSQSVDLVRRFEDRGFPFESLVIPDDTHHWMKYGNAVKVSEATAEFLKRKLMK